MRLRTVSLKNFRCFESLEVELHPRLTVFVGENGGGKTAILDAIAIALSPVLRHFSSANQRLAGPGIKDTDFRIESWTGRGGKDRWGATEYAQIVAETTDGLRWDHWRASAPGKQPAIKVGWSDLATFAEDVLNSLKTAAPSLMPVFGYYGAQRGRIEIPERLRSSKEDYTQPTAAFVGALDALSDFRSMLQWFDWMEAGELRANKGIAPDEFEETPGLAIVRATIREILGGAYRNPHFNAEHKFVLEPPTGVGTLQVSQLSQGYQSMLTLSMDFARRLAIANSHLTYADDASREEILRLLNLHSGPKEVFDLTRIPEAPAMCAPGIMLVDEIDLHLHPSWQQRVLSDLMRAFPATQFIVTTHSPQVLTSVDASCIRLLRQQADPEAGRQQTVIEGVTMQTRGVASSDLLAQIMGVDPIPDVPEARLLSDYHALIQQNLHQDLAGQAVRTRLETHFGTDHPVMRECDRMIRLQMFKQRLPVTNGGA